MITTVHLQRLARRRLVATTRARSDHSELDHRIRDARIHNDAVRRFNERWGART
jgi:hypothetical protein